MQVDIVGGGHRVLFGRVVLVALAKNQTTIAYPLRLRHGGDVLIWLVTTVVDAIRNSTMGRVTGLLLQLSRPTQGALGGAVQPDLVDARAAVRVSHA